MTLSHSVLKFCCRRFKDAVACVSSQRRTSCFPRLLRWRRSTTCSHYWTAPTSEVRFSWKDKKQILDKLASSLWVDPWEQNDQVWLERGGRFFTARRPRQANCSECDLFLAVTWSWFNIAQALLPWQHMPGSKPGPQQGSQEGWLNRTLPLGFLPYYLELITVSPKNDVLW